MRLRTLRGALLRCLRIPAVAFCLLPASCTLTINCAFSQAAQPAPHAQAVPGRVLVKFNDGVTELQRQMVYQQAGLTRIATIDPIGVHILRTGADANEHATAAMLRNRKEVEFAEVDALLSPGGAGASAGTLTPNDPQYVQQWHHPKINAPAAWAQTTGSGSVVIAILDTGIDYTHPDLAPKLVPGWNTWNNNSNVWDVHGHGTRVAGAAAASTHNGVGVAGVAWDCLIMPIRVSNNQGSASYSTIANGLTWAANNGARVANVSYRASESATVANAAHYFQNSAGGGGVVTVSAGNQSEFIAMQSVPSLLTVSATASNDALTSFTNTGNIIDIAAPGSSIRTTVMGGGYGNSSGTSFSAPIVAGVAGLVFSANPSLTGAQAHQIIMASADDLGPAGWDPGYGWGRVNASAAVALAISGDIPSTSGNGGSTSPPPPPPPPADTEPPVVTIISPTNGQSVNGQVWVHVNATDNVGVVKVELYVNGVLVQTKNGAPFSTKWNANKAPAGAHVLQVKAYDAANNVGESPPVTVYK